MKIILWTVVLTLQIFLLGFLVNKGVISQATLGAVMTGTSSVYIFWGIFSLLSAMSGRAMNQGEKFGYTAVAAMVSLSVIRPELGLIVVLSAIVALVVSKSIGGFQSQNLDPV